MIIIGAGLCVGILSPRMFIQAREIFLVVLALICTFYVLLKIIFWLVPSQHGGIKALVSVSLA